MINKYHNNIEAIINLHERGYDHDFILINEYIICIQENRSVCPDEFEVIEAFRFERERKGLGDCIVYAISLSNSDIKGILMISSSRLLRGLSIHLWSKLANLEFTSRITNCVPA